MKVLVIGDIMMDINHYCETSRMAPEANIPVYNVNNTEYILGGASNVTKNLKNLDVDIEVVSIIGDDYIGTKIKDLLDSYHIKNTLFIDPSRSTTQKVRLFNNKVIINRHDIESTLDINSYLETRLLNYLYSKENIDAILISDYGKGVITTHLCELIIDYANQKNIYTFVDPKLKNHMKYQNCFCFKPNLHEGQTISGAIEPGVILDFIKETLSCKNIVLTCGENGMYLNSITNHIINDEHIDVIDVTGSGDIVLCILVYVFLRTKDLYQACKVATKIAGKGLKYTGNYNISKQDIIEYFPDTRIIYDYETEKIKTIGELSNVVFTNGCFDIVHSAHIKLLRYAKSIGNVLVVGLNTDASVRRLKGSQRPINNQDERSEFIMSLGFVDYIILFDEDTPYSILSSLNPNTIVKGGDYTKENIIGGEFAKNIELFDYISNKSTSITINKILSKPV